jgi:hypothetical protein
LIVAENPEFDHVPLRDRPLVVCDIDEVVLEFISPFTQFLRANDHDLLPRSFRLHGNIVSLTDGIAPDNAAVSAFLEEFFRTQNQWQVPALRVLEALTELSETADIVHLVCDGPGSPSERRGLLGGSG